MRKISVWKRWLLFVCLLAVVACGCAAPAEKSAFDMGGVRSSGSTLHAPGARVQLPAFLDEEGLMDSDDELSYERVHNRRTGLAGKDFGWLLYLYCLLTGMPALFAYLSAGIFHGSACPTYELSRTLAFIFRSDGQKSYPLFS